MGLPLIALYRLTDGNKDWEIPGYFAVSTAPANVEDASSSLERDLARLPSLEPLDQRTEPGIQRIAQNLLEKAQTGSAELVIAIHGYNTPIKGVKDWYWEIWRYANENLRDKNFVFIGYRWSSESVDFLNNLGKAITSLPILLALMLVGGIVGVGLFSFLNLSWPLAIATSVMIFLGNLVAALMVLKIVVYFRDAYRATNYGVPDLVELLRQLDKELKDKVQPHSIKLNFIAHSMGGFVTTNAVRILSDVFDERSIGTTTGAGKAPSSDIGNVFRLGRLVLASPDIPAESIFAGRANFLKSSLRRFEEAYLFSNEGDLALRLASTAANYFSFPTNSRIRGHRLGNVTVRPSNKADDPNYGVINCNTLTSSDSSGRLGNYLEINTVTQSFPLIQIQKELGIEEEPIADLFTYFDCTNYLDFKYDDKSPNPVKQPLLCYRLDRFPLLNALVYLRLMFDWGRGALDVHGGYFQGVFSRKLVYELAFVGFQDFLLSLEPEVQSGSRKHYQELFQQFSEACKAKQIQVAFSPERYRVNVLGDNPVEVRREILESEPGVSEPHP